MDAHVSKAVFKSRALELLRKVEETGETLIITDRGRPALEVRPFRDPQRTPLDVLRGSLIRYEHPLQAVAENDWESVP